MMEQLPRLIPLIRSELPSLPGCHHAHYSIPRIRSEFAERLNGVHDKVPCLCLCFSPGRVDMCAFAVYRD
jgi:hypothetical protein